jgi:hypothetical protein
MYSRCVGVVITLPVEHPQRDERIEEVTRAALVEAHLLDERFGIQRSTGEFGKEAQFDGAEQGLRASEP